MFKIVININLIVFKESFIVPVLKFSVIFEIGILLSGYIHGMFLFSHYIFLVKFFVRDVTDNMKNLKL